MAKISGKCGQNSGGYTFWLEYTVTHQPSSLTTNVSVTAYLKTQGSSTWNTFSTSSKLDLTINIGGNKHTKTWSSGKDFTTSKKTYTLCTYSNNFAYSTSARSVSISASTSTETAWKSGGYGPGKLSASGSYSIPAQYSTAGTFAATVGAEDSVTMKLTSLPTAGYARTITWSHKLGTASSYTSDGTTSVGTSTTSASNAVAGLIPGTTYNFQASIKSSASTYKTWSANATTSAAAGILTVEETMPDSVMVSVRGLKSTTAIARSIKYSYKRSADTAWTLAYTGSIAANTPADNPEPPTYIYGLMPGTTYDLKAELVAGGVTYKTLTETVTTPFAGISIPKMINPGQIADNTARSGHKEFQVRPSHTLYIPWYIPDNQLDKDSLAATTFTPYVQRATGNPIACTPVSGANLSRSTINVYPSGTLNVYWHETTLDIADWVDQDEEISMYVVASNEFSPADAASQPISTVVGRYFSWDAEKDPAVQPEYNLTAEEWNHFWDYLKEAHDMGILTRTFPSSEFYIKEPGDELTDSLMNAAYSVSYDIQAGHYVDPYEKVNNKLHILPNVIHAQVDHYYDNL